MEISKGKCIFLVAFCIIFVMVVSSLSAIVVFRINNKEIQTNVQEKINNKEIVYAILCLR